MTDTRTLLARALAGDHEAYTALGIALAERRPLPPCTEEPCEECGGSGRGPTIFNPRGPDFETRCEACHGDGTLWVCEFCGGFREGTGSGACRCTL